MLWSRIFIKANMNGELEIGASTEMAFMNNYWKDQPIAPNMGVYIHIFQYVCVCVCFV